MNSVLPANCTPMPAYNIDAALVSRLIAEQHPDLEGLPLWEIEAGWDKAIFRLGDRLAVWLPRRAAAARLITNEQRWLPNPGQIAVVASARAVPGRQASTRLSLLMEHRAVA